MTCQKWVILLNFNKSWKIHHLYTWFPRVPCCCFLPYLPRSKHDIKVMFIASLLGILTMGQWVIMYPNYLHNIPIKSAHPSWLVKPSAAASACSQCGHQSPSQRPPWACAHCAPVWLMVGFSRTKKCGFSIKTFNGLVWGKIYRKPWFLPSNIGVSWKFSHHPILWNVLYQWDYDYDYI